MRGLYLDEFDHFEHFLQAEALTLAVIVPDCDAATESEPCYCGRKTADSSESPSFLKKFSWDFGSHKRCDGARSTAY